MAPRSIWQATKWENERYCVTRQGKRYKVEDLWQDTTTTLTSFARVEKRCINSLRVTQEESIKIWPVEMKVALDLISRDDHWYIECHCDGASFYARVRYREAARDIAIKMAKLMSMCKFDPKEKRSLT